MTDHDELRAIRDTLVQILGEMRVANKIAINESIRGCVTERDIEVTKELISKTYDIRREHKP